MKVLRLLMSLALFALVFTQCKKDDFTAGISDPVLKGAKPTGTYTVTVENVSTPYDYFESGVQAIPEGKDSPGPALPGDSYKFSFYAGAQHKLSIATMYGWSNDGFFAFGDMGISLYDEDTPVTGDVTSMLMLWDAGTEENQEPGMDNPHDGANVTDGMIQLMSAVGDGFDYGTVETNLKVTLDYEGNSLFTVTVENLESSKTPVSPIVWVVHFADQNPIFTQREMDYGQGLEDVAETGNPGALSSYLDMHSGYVSPIAPVLWVLHDKKDMPVFTAGAPDYGRGLEILAETGNPGPLYESLTAEGFETGVQATPFGSSENGPIFPGEKYMFSIEGEVGQTLSIATMLGASNDVFFSTGDKGIKLSNGVSEKDITHLVELYDAGTEVNEYPGAKGPEDSEEASIVQLLENVDDGFWWPTAAQVIKVTIKKN
ncbi:hypothetical protein GM418_17410 [Maribellus comscasis]|uniref:Spondin domain-containing protein n=1 Tax=Maribellus comscasis TaxID=2681766 RepID=A0A6I6JR08_9BACT|nr:spondin domain-containing protein [Maribellus comscasis]QGY45386.1 hypothetical protein GM418_17410 [Maribellus comscasis]